MNARPIFEPDGAEFQTSVLVLADLQQSWGLEPPIADEALLAAIENCRAVLARARQLHMPVAFVRRVYPWLLTCAPWVTGFLPTVSEMIFERSSHSCYASGPFAEMAEAAGSFTLAGLFAESTGLATAIDALSRRHRIVFLADASWSNPCGDYSAAEMHRAATMMVATHGKVSTANAWLSATA